MTIASIAFILLIIFIISKYGLFNKNTFKFFISILFIFNAFINIGYFLNIKNFKIDFEEIITFLLLISSLGIKTKNKYMNSLFIISLVFFISIIFGILFEILIPYKKGVFTSTGIEAADYILHNTKSSAHVGNQSFRYLIRIFIFILIIQKLPIICNHNDLSDIINILCFAWVPIIIFCVFEFLCKNIIHTDLYRIILELLFNDSGHVETIRSGINVITGLRYEPTQLATGIWIFLLLILYGNKTDKYLILSFIAGTSLILASGSLKGIMFIFVLIFIYVFKKKLFKIFHIFIISIMIFGIYVWAFDKDFSINYYLVRIGETFRIIFSFGKNISSVTSEGYRLKTVFDSLNNFIERPIFGLGVGVSFCYGAIPMILANTGVIGLFLYVNILKKLKIRIRTFLDLIICVLLIIVYFTVGTIASLYDLSLIVSLMLIFNKGFINDEYENCNMFCLS